MAKLAFKMASIGWCWVELSGKNVQMTIERSSWYLIDGTNHIILTFVESGAISIHNNTIWNSWRPKIKF